MNNYCVNKNTDENGYHEVHQLSCNHLPIKENRIEFFAVSDSSAMIKAKDFYSNVDGCYYCMRAHHKG